MGMYGKIGMSRMTVPIKHFLLLTNQKTAFDVHRVGTTGVS